MYVVIFQATIKSMDEEYVATAAKLRELALSEFGCTRFESTTEGEKEIALSYWPSIKHIKAWKNHPDHINAQELGKSVWYASYNVQIAKLI